MNQKSEIISLLKKEEGKENVPYIDSLGYPSVGVGFKLGPAGASLSHYTFTLTDQAIDAWLQSNVDAIYLDAADYDEVVTASIHCNMPRQDILTSMAYQLGLVSLSYFHHMLQAIISEDWEEAAAQMLDSSWGKQTPERANRHAAVMRSGQWAPTYNF